MSRPAGSSSAPTPTNRSFSSIPSQSSIGRASGRLNFSPFSRRDVSTFMIRFPVGMIRSPVGTFSPCGLLTARLRDLGRAAKPDRYRAAVARHRAGLRLLLLRDPVAHEHGIYAQLLANLRHLTNGFARQARQLHTVAFG